MPSGSRSRNRRVVVSLLSALPVPLLDGDDFVQTLEEAIDDARVKLRTTPGAQNVVGFVVTHPFLVGAPGCEGIEDVRHGANPGVERDCLALQAIRIPGAVPSLVVAKNDRLSGLEEF